MSQLVAQREAPVAVPPVGSTHTERGLRGRARRRSAAVWFFRAFLPVPFVLMAPEIISFVRGRPDAAAHLSGSGADVLGTSSFIFFLVMLAVTPVHTMTGWQWPVVLRRDYGVAMCAVAATDLLFAAITTGDSFPGGFMSRVGGHTFLWAGTVATLLTLPLAVTATRRAKRWLGRYWKWFHRLTYVVWGAILLHLLLLFAFRTFFQDALLASVALALPRIPALRRWWVTSRRARSHRVLRSALAIGMAGTFLLGFVPFVQELAGVGVAAFHQSPVAD